MDCECGAHYMQNCSWWCGMDLTAEEIWERENPEAAELKKIRLELEKIRKLKEIGGSE